MSKAPHVNVLEIFSAMFLPNIIWIGLQLGKLSQNTKAEHFIETQCRVL